MKPLLIFRFGGTFSELARDRGDFEDWILAGMGLARRDAILFDVAQRQSEDLPEHESVRGAVLPGSHDMLTECPAWLEWVSDWVAGALFRGVPLLGICYGHQILAHAFGGVVGDNPRGTEIGSVPLRLHEAAGDDPVLGGLRSGDHVYVSHTQSALALPEEAVLLASSDREPHHAFRIGSVAWGVQFHPEFDAAITRYYINRGTELLRSQGQSPERLARECVLESSGGTVLQRFSAVTQEVTL